MLAIGFLGGSDLKKWLFQSQFFKSLPPNPLLAELAIESEAK